MRSKRSKEKKNRTRKAHKTVAKLELSKKRTLTRRENKKNRVILQLERKDLESLEMRCPMRMRTRARKMSLLDLKMTSILQNTNASTGSLTSSEVDKDASSSLTSS